MICGGMGEGSVETSLLCFCVRWGTCADPGILPGGGGSRPDCHKTGLATFFSPQLPLQFYRGSPMVISKKTIIFNIF